MKKKLTLLLLFLALPLVGCEKDDSSTTSKSSTATPSVSTPSTSESEMPSDSEAPSATPSDSETLSETPSESSSSSSSEQPTHYTIMFYSDSYLFTTVDVAVGSALVLPPQPEKTGYTFSGWFYDMDTKTAYDENAPITASFSLYAKWLADTPTGQAFHIIGDPQNSALSTIHWLTIEQYHEDSLLVYSAINLHYQTILELGYGAEFKIKEPGKAWNDYDNNVMYGDEFGYLALDKKSSLDKLETGENGNIIVLVPGFYTITLTLGAEQPLLIYYNAAATSPGVTPVPPQTYRVRFYKDSTITPYFSTDVIEGENVNMPEPPTFAGLTFAGWYTEREYINLFDGSAPINAATNVYAKWVDSEGNVTYPGATQKALHLIGNFGNEESADWWDVSGNNEYYHLTYDETRGVYKNKRNILLGHDQEFKIKEIGKEWEDTESYIFDFDDIDASFAYSYLERGNLNNIRVKLAGNYEIVVDLNTEKIKITWVTNYDGNNTDEQTIIMSHYGIVGTHNGWGEDGSDTFMHFDKATGVHFRRAIFFEAGAQWKIRANSTWGEPHENPGARPGNVLEGMENAPEGSPDNIVVTESGYYTVVFDGENFTVAKTGFALRGNVVASGWEHDSIPFTLVEEINTNTYLYELTLALTPGEYRFKLAEVGEYSGLDYSPRHSESINYIISETYNYKLTLKIIYDDFNDTFTHTFTIKNV